MVKALLLLILKKYNISQKKKYVKLMHSLVKRFIIALLNVDRNVNWDVLYYWSSLVFHG